MEKHVSTAALTDAELTLIDRYWRAANYLSIGQIYLLTNPLLREPLKPEHIKPRLLGHWGTTPGLNFIYAHLNRLIRARDLDIIYMCGPGHGGPGMVANTYLEGIYSEIYPDISEDAEGMRKLFRQFSFPGGIPSHAAPETPGSIHEGGELGYALVHAYGAAFDNPDLIVACVVGDGEAETGPLAASWHSNKFLNPARDGAVLPILHLNGYKIANPTILGRASHEDLQSLFEGYGYEPFFVEGHEPRDMHKQMAATFDRVFDRIREIQEEARNGKAPDICPRWPMIVLRSPKGWTGPKEVDGKKVEGFWRSHQVPVSNCRENEGHRKILEDWMRSYDPKDLFGSDGRLKPELRALAPVGERRMGANPHANGGLLRKELDVPSIRDYAVDIGKRGRAMVQSTEILGRYLRDTMKRNAKAANFRIFGPDETESNRLGSVFEVTDRVWMEGIEPYDVHLSRDGRVMEVLSEHLCQGWLEGYLLTGRHGLFSCYEAFIHIIDSMFNQHAKWLKVTRELEWRKPISSLNYLLTSHVWRQDHNGFSHQDPGFVDLVANKKADIVRIYLPPDANTLLWVGDHCLRTYDRVNVIVAGKQPEPQWLSMDEAVKHCEAGIGIWHWASNEEDTILPDLVMACAGDVPTMETLAAVDLLRRAIPELKIRTVNVVDLLALQSRDQHPHGLADEAFDAIFTAGKPVIFAYHGYPYLIHRLTYKRTNHRNIHVRGFIEEGTTTTPFDMTVLNELDRFHLAIEAIERVPGLKEKAGEALAAFRGKLAEHHDYVREYGEDMPEVRNWTWPTA
ncbi:phosphoketolase family protein [Rhizobium leguminosarum]|uniref:phosphoketolase family protein n=1 Tax=Rhizobium leguminosarum TaxID=384 RepID=UPI001031C734|nr:phosphoketolase family protein [Rhizobium leguminosarum]TAV90961.1 phosphoketolase family protein [Rhizobium leguminosarum]TAV95566.1 phosphoketolase family protein [Rhizobium leguminosarum]TAW36644.1 phosphoketolase family protein [Rhizobium leguminosarum]TAX31489.1 phosphoketolase family protein [Rhizobium leguminosarum]TAY34248.1 phosphoketolase family protein [Rhizobium leguminosarum]